MTRFLAYRLLSVGRVGAGDVAEPAPWLEALSWMERIVGWEERGDLRITELLHKSSFRPRELKERERKT